MKRTRLGGPRLRVCLITNIATPYRVPVYRAIYEQLGTGFRVLLLSKSENNRAWAVDASDFPHRVLPGRHIHVASRDWALHFNTGIRRGISDSNPDVVAIAGWDNPSYWWALACARSAGLPVVLWSGSHALSCRTTGGPVAWARARFVKAADAYISYGTRAAEFLSGLGAPGDHIVVGTNAVESGRFASAPPRDVARQHLGIQNDDEIVLFSGQLIERKGIDTLIRALARIARKPILWIVGDGPLRREYEALARRLLPDRVSFLGHRGYSELPIIYSAADVFVMPSRVEVWGLVLNEAMASGLPVISSLQAGATADLVLGKDTGLAFDANSIDDLAAHLTTLLDSPALRARYGANGRKLIARLDTRQYASDFLKAAELAMRVRGHSLRHA